MIVIKASLLPCELLIVIIPILQMRKQTLSNSSKVTLAALPGLEPRHSFFGAHVLSLFFF